MPSLPNSSKPSIKTFFREHKKTALLVTGSILVIIVAILIVIFTAQENDGVPGDDSRPYEASAAEDSKALKNYKIANYLPITSADPAYTITYKLDRDDSGNYNLGLVLNAFAASARDACVNRLLTENFGGEDPLTFNVELENYYNPFTNYSLDNLSNGNLPSNFQKTTLYTIENTPFSIQILKHTLYDGSENTYRYILENNQAKTLPKLFYTYSELPFLDQNQVRSLNQLR